MPHKPHMITICTMVVNASALQLGVCSELECEKREGEAKRKKNKNRMFDAKWKALKIR